MILASEPTYLVHAWINVRMVRSTGAGRIGPPPRDGGRQRRAECYCTDLRSLGYTFAGEGVSL